MKSILLNPTYFGPIDLFATVCRYDRICWENEDNYQKQTYRTRQYIYGASGALLLNIPIVHKDKTQPHQKYKETRIDNQYDWQRIHWKSLEAAYSSSPFFEFYRDELEVLYKDEFTFLQEFNKACWKLVLDCLGTEKMITQTKSFKKDYSEEKNIADFRKLSIAKRKPFIELPEYPQVFMEKHGFLSNLSVLDLLFNQGPGSLSYLKEIPIQQEIQSQP